MEAVWRLCGGCVGGCVEAVWEAVWGAVWRLCRGCVEGSLTKGQEDEDEEDQNGLPHLRRKQHTCYR